ncbi:MAG: ribonuclease HI [Minisyncoccia bacterium]
MNKKIIIFTDGSSRGNPGPGGWGAIINDGEKITELGGRENITTNNRMELLGAIHALKKIEKPTEEIFLNTDSSYLINGITKWIYGWQKKGWKNSLKEEVANRDLWEKLYEVSKDRKIKWNYVSGHSGVPGNERCDEIATAFADNTSPKLFLGKKSGYKINLDDLSQSGVKKNSSRKKKNKMPAYSYISLVGGILKIDKTWSECEKRVRGVKGGAKYKKVGSEEEEKQVMAEWGF